MWGGKARVIRIRAKGSKHVKGQLKQQGRKAQLNNGITQGHHVCKVWGGVGWGVLWYKARQGVKGYGVGCVWGVWGKSELWGGVANRVRVCVCGNSMGCGVGWGKPMGGWARQGVSREG